MVQWLTSPSNRPVDVGSIPASLIVFFLLGLTVSLCAKASYIFQLIWNISPRSFQYSFDKLNFQRFQYIFEYSKLKLYIISRSITPRTVSRVRMILPATVWKPIFMAFLNRSRIVMQDYYNTTNIWVLNYRHRGKTSFWWMYAPYEPFLNIFQFRFRFHRNYRK